MARHSLVFLLGLFGFLFLWNPSPVEGADYGCYRGYCWAYCLGGFTAFPVLGLLSPTREWCYTTVTHSQSQEYVQCSSDEYCSPSWNCGGPCSI